MLKGLLLLQQYQYAIMHIKSVNSLHIMHTAPVEPAMANIMMMDRCVLWGHHTTASQKQEEVEEGQNSSAAVFPPILILEILQLI